MRREKQKSTLFIDSLYRHLFDVPLAAHTVGLIAAWRPQTLYSQMLCELSMDQAVRIAKRSVQSSSPYNGFRNGIPQTIASSRQSFRRDRR